MDKDHNDIVNPKEQVHPYQEGKTEEKESQGYPERNSNGSAYDDEDPLEDVQYNHAQASVSEASSVRATSMSAAI